MSIGFVFWLIMLIGFIFWAYAVFTPATPYGRYHPIVWWVLLFLLGWGTFGFPIHG